MREDAEALYERARAVPPDDRIAFLEDACRGDPQLRDRLTSLLARAEPAEAFFQLLRGAVFSPADSIGIEDAGVDGRASDDAPSSATVDPLIGRTIGRYTILSHIGSGGMGTVYAAHDARLKREVALKFLPYYLTALRDAEERLLAEARAAAALEHPNVCVVHEIGETADGRPFIAMARYEGETLGQRLRRGPLPPDEAVAVAVQIARGLGAAHARGIIHRDVKPGNVMLTPDGTVKLLDFGLAKVADVSLTDARATPGTVSYMSPEQVRGAPLDRRTDLWSLGVVLHEMLTGERPFRGGNDRALLQAILYEAPEPLAARRPEIPEPVRRIVDRLLRKDPDERYGSAGELVGDLTSAPGVRSAPNRPRAWRVAAVALVAAASVLGAWAVWPGAAERERSVAQSVGVLPFLNMSPDADNAYFSDGLTEQIITALSHIDGLRVAARTSSFALRDGRLDVRAIGDTLGVAAVLEGSVRKDGNALRVTAQLIDATTGYHIWSAEYDRELRDVFAVQDEIARAIAGALELRLASGGTGHAAQPQPQFAAYDLYLRGLYQRNTLNGDAMRLAIAYFDSAIAREPTFALAYAAKASVLAPLILFNHLPPEDGIRDMREATMRALALDSTIGEAHAALGIVRLFWDWEWDEAERALLRAVELNPNDAHAWHHLANHHRAVGRLEEAIAVRNRAVQLDPVNARTIIVLGTELLTAGHSDSALAVFRRGQQLDPSHTLFLGSTGPWLPTGAGEVFLWQGRDAEAVEQYLKVATLRGASSGTVDSLRQAFADSGSTGFWRRWLEMDIRQSGGNPDPLRIAKLWGRAGDTNRSLEWLERAYAERNPGLTFLQVDPAFASLRSHPRMQRILAEMKFPEISR